MGHTHLVAMSSDYRDPGNPIAVKLFNVFGGQDRVVVKTSAW